MIPNDVISSTESHLRRFIPEWKDEFPLRIHDSGLAADGAPRYSGEFSRWLNRGDKRRDDEDHPETKLRLTRAMRKLRKVAPREHDTLYKILAGESVQDVCRWLNERAIRGGHPERYSMKDTVVIIISGVDKIAFWY